MRIAFDIVGILLIAIGSFFVAALLCHAFDFDSGSAANTAMFIAVACVAGIPCGSIVAYWSQD